MSLMLTDRIEESPAPRTLRLVGGTAVDMPSTCERRPTRPSPRPVAQSFARGVAEVMARARSVDQLRDLATWEVVRMIERAASRQPIHRMRPIVRSVHLSTVCEGVIEACATIDGDIRSRALAFRLESNGLSWRATLVQFG